MEDRALAEFLKNLSISECTVVIPNHIYRHEYDRNVMRNGRLVNEFGDFLIITDVNLEKKAIIMRVCNDVHWHVLEPFRGQHWLSNALRTGYLKKLWPEITSITCINSESVDEYDKTVHLAELAGLSVREEDHHTRAYRETCREYGVKELSGNQQYDSYMEKVKQYEAEEKDDTDCSD